MTERERRKHGDDRDASVRRRSPRGHAEKNSSSDKKSSSNTRRDIKREHDEYTSKSERGKSRGESSYKQGNSSPEKSNEPTFVTVGSKTIVKRHVNQLFVRGDNVVMVALVD